MSRQGALRARAGPTAAPPTRACCDCLIALPPAGSCPEPTSAPPPEARLQPQGLSEATLQNQSSSSMQQHGVSTVASERAARLSLASVPSSHQHVGTTQLSAPLRRLSHENCPWAAEPEPQWRAREREAFAVRQDASACSPVILSSLSCAQSSPSTRHHAAPTRPAEPCACSHLWSL